MRPAAGGDACWVRSPENQVMECDIMDERTMREIDEITLQLILARERLCLALPMWSPAVALS